MCEYCENPNKTIVTHMSGVEAFVGAGNLCLRFYVQTQTNPTINRKEATNAL